MSFVVHSCHSVSSPCEWFPWGPPRRPSTCTGGGPPPTGGRSTPTPPRGGGSTGGQGYSIVFLPQAECTKKIASSVGGKLLAGSSVGRKSSLTRLAKVDADFFFSGFLFTFIQWFTVEGGARVNSPPENHRKSRIAPPVTVYPSVYVSSTFQILPSTFATKAVCMESCSFSYWFYF